MKIKHIVIFLLTVSLYGCGGDNSFESAFNPFTGNKAKADIWRDQGGLDKKNNFYGVNVSNISYTFQANGMVDQLTLVVDSGTSPETMRKALVKACRTNDSAFQRVPNYPRGGVWLFPNGSSPGLGKLYDLSCIYEGDTQKMYIYSKLKSSNP